MNIDHYVGEIVDERQRQFDRIGTEFDIEKSPNDWIALAASLLTDATSRYGAPVSKEEFERAFVKAAAVCIAALQHSDYMMDKKKLC